MGNIPDEYRCKHFEQIVANQIQQHRIGELGEKNDLGSWNLAKMIMFRKRKNITIIVHRSAINISYCTLLALFSPTEISSDATTIKYELDNG